MTVYLAYGPQGSGKTYFSLSGTGRKWYGEFDPGGFERSGADPDDPNIEVHRYPPPLQSLLELGKLDLQSVGRTGSGGVQVSYKLVGWQETFWQGFITDYMQALSGDFTDFILDTNKMEWEMCRNAFRQRVQEETDLDEQRRLTRLDYATPNEHQTQIIQGAKARGKNLIMVAHEKGEWKNNEPTGRQVPDGWKEAEDFADIALRFFVRDKRPVGVIYKAASGGLDLIDMEVVEPTIDKMDTLIRAATALRRAGIPLAGMDAEAIVQTAEMVQ